MGRPDDGMARVPLERAGIPRRAFFPKVGAADQDGAHTHDWDHTTLPQLIFPNIVGPRNGGCPRPVLVLAVKLQVCHSQSVAFATVECRARQSRQPPCTEVEHPTHTSPLAVCGVCVCRQPPGPDPPQPQEYPIRVQGGQHPAGWVLLPMCNCNRPAARLAPTSFVHPCRPLQGSRRPPRSLG
jgi:hypothetical protein